MNHFIREERNKNKRLNTTVNKAVKLLAELPSEEFDCQLMDVVCANKIVECAYVLDEHGIQISKTVCLFDKDKENLIFYSARMGTDHSMEKYYYPLRSAKLSKYITEPYISLATGNLCITFSKTFMNKENKRFILCMDFKTVDAAYTLELRNSVLNLNDNTLQEMSTIISKMSEEIIKDGLTGAYNRRYIEERLLIDVFNSTNEKQPISIILADLDFFKEINDTYGHPAGDHVLREFVRIAKKCVRKKTDWIARYGGDEFLIVLINADEVIADRVSEKIRSALERSVIHYHGKGIKITASFGMYTVHSEKFTCEQLICQADSNLYKAKNSGRNKTHG